MVSGEGRIIRIVPGLGSGENSEERTGVEVKNLTRSCLGGSWERGGVWGDRKQYSKGLAGQVSRLGRGVI